MTEPKSTLTGNDEAARLHVEGGSKRVAQSRHTNSMPISSRGMDTAARSSIAAKASRSVSAGREAGRVV